jgi:PhoPQ-activated pathogenicity-related protein
MFRLPKMAAIIDPYVYRERYLNRPKLVIDAGGDEFFQVYLFVFIY